MENNQQQVPGTLVGVKRVRRDTDAKGREKIVLTFGLDQNGENTLDGLLNALESLRGKQANVDIRISEKQTEGGASFETAFVIVKEMIPKSAGGGAPKGKFVPKNKSRAEDLKARAKQISQSLEE